MTRKFVKRSKFSLFFFNVKKKLASHAAPASALGEGKGIFLVPAQGLHHKGVANREFRYYCNSKALTVVGTV